MNTVSTLDEMLLYALTNVEINNTRTSVVFYKLSHEKLQTQNRHKSYLFVFCTN